MTKIIINGVERDMTSAEETEHQEAHKNLIADKKIRLDALEVKKTNKTSAQNKLKALGLTDAEIKAL
jgi:hypothetical protein